MKIRKWRYDEDENLNRSILMMISFSASIWVHVDGRWLSRPTYTPSSRRLYSASTSSEALLLLHLQGIRDWDKRDDSTQNVSYVENECIDVDVLKTKGKGYFRRDIMHGRLCTHSSKYLLSINER